MPRIGVTIYDLLLSCPGDVLDLKEVIEECVKAFNSSLGEANNVRVELKHWSTDGFAQSGDKPQNILNKQFIDDCDMCVALLGTRFGTPTDNYDSGTEEEIEKMLEKNKQVFLYFVERPVEPDKIDIEQYGKVKNFKKAYESKGLYTVVKSREDLRSEFQNALSLYFIKLISPQMVQFSQPVSPNLTIYSTDGEKGRVAPFHTDYQHIKIVRTQEEKINKLIDTISTIDVILSTNELEDNETTEYSDEEIGQMSMADVTKAAEDKKISSKQLHRLMGTKPPSYSKVIVEDDKKGLISNFCLAHNKVLEDDFYYLGNLIKETKFSFIVLGNSEGVTYLGSDSEKEKYDHIVKLVKEIRKYNHMVEFFAKIDTMEAMSFLIENTGKTYDEDIDVKIFIEKGCIADIDDIPEPGLLFLEEVVNEQAPIFLFSERNNADTECFSNYPIINSTYSTTIDFFKSRDEEILELRSKYRDLLEFVFCYDVRESETEDILCFNIPYLKQNTKMYFPSYLLFHKTPKTIRYEIRSKRSPEVYKGIFDIM